MNHSIIPEFIVENRSFGYIQRLSVLLPIIIMFVGCRGSFGGYLPKSVAIFWKWIEKRFCLGRNNRQKYICPGGQPFQKNHDVELVEKAGQNYRSRYTNHFLIMPCKNLYLWDNIRCSLSATRTGENDRLWADCGHFFHGLSFSSV